MWKYGIILALPLLALGCGSSQRSAAPATAPAKPADTALLEPLLLAEKPAQPRSVDDVREHAKDGEELALVGQIPPGEGNVFLRDRAGFVLMAKSDIDKNRGDLECAKPG
jgi:hypothetical protein